MIIPDCANPDTLGHKSNDGCSSRHAGKGEK